jgi:hypothetical protein
MARPLWLLLLDNLPADAGESGAQPDAVDCLAAVDKSIAFECGHNVFQPGPIGFLFCREQ